MADIRNREDRPLDRKVMELAAHIRMGLNRPGGEEREQVYASLLYALSDYATLEQLHSGKYIVEMVKSYKQTRAEIPGQTKLFEGTKL